MKPKEYDIVRLRRPLPEHNLPAGSTGAVVTDYTTFADKSLPPAYEVEFADSHGMTIALATLSEDDIEVVQRSDDSELPYQGDRRDSDDEPQ